MRIHNYCDLKSFFKQLLNFAKSRDTQQLKTFKMSFQISVGKVDYSINDDSDMKKIPNFIFYSKVNPNQ